MTKVITLIMVLVTPPGHRDIVRQTVEPTLSACLDDAKEFLELQNVMPGFDGKYATCLVKDVAGEDN